VVVEWNEEICPKVVESFVCRRISWPESGRGAIKPLSPMTDAYDSGILKNGRMDSREFGKI
jgi:hypothetical protein